MEHGKIAAQATQWSGNCNNEVFFKFFMFCEITKE